MIKGKSITISDHYRTENLSEAYIDFILLVNKLEIELAEGAKTEIKYINSHSLKNYGLLLKSEFENTISQINHNIDALQSKNNKIIELRNHTTDFEMLFPFINQQLDLWSHKNVSFKNLPANGSKEDILANKQIQECYQNIDFFTKRLNLFFLALKDTIQASTETPFPAVKLSELGISSLRSENPFAFFEYIFQSNGIKELINEFEPKEEDVLNHGIDFNKETLTKIYQERAEDGEWITHEIRFINNLKKIVSMQLQASKRCLKTKIELISDSTAVSDYLLHSLNSLIRMYQNQLSGIDILYQKPCKDSIKKIISYIDAHYKVYLKPKAINIIKKFQQNVFNDEDTIQYSDAQTSYHFTIKGIAKEKFILQAWQLFMNECVHEKDYDLFLNVFEGKIKQDKLKRIKWLKIYNLEKIKIKPLIYFFDKLRLLGVIDETEATLKKKIQIMFADSKGKELKSIQQKFNQYKKDPGHYPDIDKLFDFNAK